MSITFNVTKVKDLMTPNPVTIDPGDTLQQAARKMEIADCGILPVGTGNKLKGMITDRDIVVRAIASGKDPAHVKVADYMTAAVYACNENDTLEEAAVKMREHKVSRLVVTDKEGKVTGILSFGFVFRNDASAEEVANVLKHAAGPVCC